MTLPGSTSGKAAGSVAGTEWHRREMYLRKRKEETLVNSLHFPSPTAWEENSTEKAWHKFYVDFFVIKRGIAA